MRPRTGGRDDGRQMGGDLGAHLAFVPIGRRHMRMPRRERKMFGSKKEAVNFVMSLDDPQRRTAQLHLPDGDIVYLPRIEQMYADIKR